MKRTYLQYRTTAHRQATRLAAHLGPGWNVEVWDNLGWHWAVRLGEAPGLQVRPSGDTAWFAFIDLPTYRNVIVWRGSGLTPQEAISNCMAQGSDELMAKLTLFETVKAQLKAPKPAGPHNYLDSKGRIIGTQTDIDDYVKEKQA